jgi:type III pantothenate kinase
VNLYVDIGNSRIRLAQDSLDAGSVIAFYYTPGDLTKLFEAHCGGGPVPDRVIVASVAGDDIEQIFTGLCMARWSIQPKYLKVSRHGCGVTNAYVDPGQLGVDRWLATIAAWNKYKKNLCVVDCGSAVTADIVRADGQHLGGYILPGRYMMQQALIAHTGRIVINAGYQYTERAGRTTEECVFNGTTLAVVASIEHIVRSVVAGQGDVCDCIITGGGAGEVMKLMNIHYHHEPMLVLEGIKLAGEG